MRRQPASALDLFIDSTRLLGDTTLVSVLEFDRHIDAERLGTAAGKCFEAFPILASRMVRGDGPAYWEYCGLTGPVNVQILKIGEEDYRQYVVKGMDARSAPQACFRVLRSPEKDVVVVNMAHAAADGYGMIELSRTLLLAYNDPNSVKPCEDILPPRDTLWTEKLLGAVPVPDRSEVRLIDPMWPSPCGRSNARSLYHRAVIDKEGIGEIKRMARSHGGTVNDVLMAAYFMSMSDLTGHYGPQNLFFPVNLRRYLRDSSRAMSNQAANVSLIITRGKGEGISEVLDRIISGTRGMKSDLIGVREQVEFDRGSDSEGRAVQRMVESMEKKQEEGLADIFISNPGPMNLPPAEGLAGAYICYPGVYMPSTCFVISTFRDEMSVVMGYQDEERPKNVTAMALEGMIAHLGLGSGRARFQ